MDEVRICKNTGCDRPAVKHRTVCSNCRSKAYYAAHPGYKAADVKARNERVKAEFIRVYGGECECCGESQPVFLTMDHANNDGGGRNRQSRSYVRWVIAIERYGDGTYALLCFNCNTGRHINGGICPHVEERTRH